MTTLTTSSAPSSVITTDDGCFERDVLQQEKVALVEFGGTWCPPCRAMEPTLAALARDRPDVAVVTVNVDDNPVVTQRYGVRSLPTLIVFQGGRPVGQLVGAQKRAALEK